MTRRLTLSFSFFLFVSAFSAFAQVPPFGEAVPLANTRYGSAGGNLILRTDGRDAFVFWVPYAGPLYMTKIVPGERHVGRPVLNTSAGDGFDAVWAGDHFLVVSASGSKLTGSNIDRSGRPIGEPFTILDGVAQPRLAYTGKTILMLYKPSSSSSAVQSIVLDRSGRAISAPQLITLNGGSPATAATSTRVAVLMGTRLVMLDENGQIVGDRELPAFGGWSVASDGTRFLAVVSSASGVTATLIDANGTSLRTTALANAPAFPFQAMWTGSVWKVAHAAGTKLNVVTLDRDATRILSSNQSDWLGAGSMIAINERLINALPNGNEKILASEIPATPERIEEIGFTAVQQALLATARSTNAVLAVWRETNAGASTIHAGVRSSEGAWRERELASGTTAIAASNGREFIVIVNNKLFRLNESGAPLANALLPFEAIAIGWNGQSYGVLGSSQFALLSSTGTLGDVKPAQVPVAYFPCAPMASDGHGFFTACYIPSNVSPGFTIWNGIFGIRFDAAGTVLETFTINSGNPSLGGVAFDGRRYLVGWNDGLTVKVTYDDPQSLDTRIVATNARSVSISNNAISSGAFIGWLDSASQYRVAFIDSNANVSASMIAERGIEPWQTELLQLDYFHLLRIYTTASMAAPHYGAQHVMSQTGLIAFPYLPDPPKLTVTRGAETARLEWQTTGKRIDLFRIEYAVGDGVWIEMETSVDASRRSFDFPLFWTDATYSFRVRAINEAGSVYSAPVTSMIARRRSVR